MPALRYRTILLAIVGGLYQRRCHPHLSPEREDVLLFVDFDEVVVLVVVVILIVVLVDVLEDVEGELDAQLGEEDVVVGEEGVAQRQFGGFERGVIGLVSIACDVEVVLECVQQARQRAAGTPVMTTSLP